MRLDHFLKVRGIAATGGQAKLLIQNGEVSVNGEVETRRRRKLHEGDFVEALGQRVAFPGRSKDGDGLSDR